MEFKTLSRSLYGKYTSALLREDDPSLPWVIIDYESEAEATKLIDEFNLREYQSSGGVRFLVNVRV
jgi:hypothetical protein